MKQSINKTVRGEHSVNTGVLTEYEIDLEVNEGFGGGSIFADMLGYTKASATISSVGAVGSSGTIDVKQSNDINGTNYDLSTPKSLTVSPTGDSGAFDIDVSGQYLILDTSAVTFGVEGRLIIKIIAKR